MQIKLKFFKKEKSFKKKNPELNPNFFWSLLVGAVFVSSLLSLLFGYYLFKQMSQEPVSTNAPGVEQKTISKERINKVLEYFSLKEQKSKQILNSPAPIVDPSL